MVERLLDQQPVNARGVEDEVGAVGILISDHAAETGGHVSRATWEIHGGRDDKLRSSHLREQGYELRGLRQDVDVVEVQRLGDGGLRLLVVGAVFGPDTLDRDGMILRHAFFRSWPLSSTNNRQSYGISQEIGLFSGYMP